jgi:hypothetical protein
MKIRKSLLVEAAKNRPEGYLEDVYSFVESEDVEFVYISNDNYMLLKNKYTVEHGLPGTELKKLISWFPIPAARKKCGRCKSLELKMNKWGCETCETEKRDYIIRKLMISAKRNGVPTSEFLVGALLKKAIRNAKLRQ